MTPLFVPTPSIRDTVNTTTHLDDVVHVYSIPVKEYHWQVVGTKHQTDPSPNTTATPVLLLRRFLVLRW